MLWIAIHLGQLPLEIFTRGHPALGPLVVAQVAGTQRSVFMANTSALQQGITPGMRVSAAHALTPQLRVLERDPRAEHAALEQLAAWAGQFTAQIHVIAPSALALEVGGSLVLFRGLPRLWKRIRSGLHRLNYNASLAVAPTVFAALWCARAQQEIIIAETRRLTDALAPLSLGYTDFTVAQQQSLQGMGVRCLGDALRLPRAGLARRFGPELVLMLDRALGKMPDPRVVFVAPQRYEGTLVLPYSMDNSEALLFPLQRLLLELTGQLRAHGCGVRRVDLLLQHHKAPVSVIELSLTTPSRDSKHLLYLFRERVQRVSLPEAVESMVVRALTWEPLLDKSRDFFTPRHGTPSAASELIERLQARLGADAVQGLRVVAEHRPESAWRYCAPGTPASRDNVKYRPVWLLPEPLPLDEHAGQPQFDGALLLEPDRERIEGGWWDGQDAARDYFIASTAQGARLWIYRELSAARRWMLHGFFA